MLDMSISDRPRILGKAEKERLTELLMGFGILPKLPCQLVFHCVDGKVQAIEIQKLRLG